MGSTSPTFQFKEVKLVMKISKISMNVPDIQTCGVKENYERSIRRAFFQRVT